MAYKAKKDFPEIDYKKSIVVGDSESDIAFATNINAVPFLIESEHKSKINDVMVFNNLLEFARFIKSVCSCK